MKRSYCFCMVTEVATKKARCRHWTAEILGFFFPVLHNVSMPKIGLYQRCYRDPISGYTWVKIESTESREPDLASHDLYSSLKSDLVSLLTVDS